MNGKIVKSKEKKGKRKGERGKGKEEREKGKDFYRTDEFQITKKEEYMKNEKKYSYAKINHYESRTFTHFHPQITQIAQVTYG